MGQGVAHMIVRRVRNGQEGAKTSQISFSYMIMARKLVSACAESPSVLFRRCEQIFSSENRECSRNGNKETETERRV